MKTDLIVALAALEQQLDTVLFRSPDEEEQHTGRNLAIAGAGGAAAGGGLLADRAIMRKYGQRQLLGTGQIKPGSPRSILGRIASTGETFGGSAAVGRRAAYGAAASDIGQRVSNISRAARTAGKQAYRVTRDHGEGLLTAVGRGLRKGLKVGVSKLSVGEDVTDRLLALAAKADDVLAFDLDMGDHIVRHIGGPVGVAATSKKGKKGEAFKESLGQLIKSHAIGIGAGLGGGALLGGGLAAAKVLRHGRGGLKAANSFARRNMLKEAAKAGDLTKGALRGGFIGANVGNVVGAIHGTHGKNAREIQKKHHA
ncbi:MAG: hypothetical protein QOE70_914 [Chthoniobacter sp.]|jgi:hypothetical protein|nr:hypothetical protein [Chthoniobacter sp.]